MSTKNGVIDAGPYGSWDVWVESVVYGMRVLSGESEARRFRTYYPKRTVSGHWFLNVIFDSHEEHQRFSRWMVDFFRAVSNPYGDTPNSMTVSVPSRGFLKRGYPGSSINFGDEFGKVVYRESIQFSSATDGYNESDASKFRGPSNDSEAYYFYPSGLQPGELVNPGPGPLIGVVGDDSRVYGGGGGGNGRRAF